MTAKIYLREPCAKDEAIFLSTMNKSQDFHAPFILAPINSLEFQSYLQKSQMVDQKYYIAWSQDNNIIGIFNISAMSQGFFKSAYLGYYASVDYAGQGLMSLSLKLVLNKIFTDLDLHRIEANIQPTNTASIHLATKNGFLKEGFSPRYLKVNGIWQDHFRFAQTIEDWMANQQGNCKTI